MSTDINAVRGALKLGFFVSSLTVASLGARLASATISPHGADDARAYAITRISGASLSDAALQSVGGTDAGEIGRFDPGAPRARLVDLLTGYERQPDLLLRGLDVTPQTAAELNASIPLSDAPNPPARPFVLHADAADRDRALTCLTQAVYYEAGFEPLNGEQAVAQVVLNRVRHPIFPNSVCGVVYQGAALKTGCQFSFTCDGSLSKTPAVAAWARARKVAEQALNGYVDKAVGEATHYHTRFVAPWWAPTVTKVAEIGAHIFYRWPGALGLPAAFDSRYAGVERIGGLKADALASTPTETAGLVESDGKGRVHAVLTVAEAAPSPAEPTFARAHGVISSPDADVAAAQATTPLQRMRALAAKHALGAGFSPGAATAAAPAPTTAAAPAVQTTAAGTE